MVEQLKMGRLLISILSVILTIQRITADNPPAQSNLQLDFVTKANAQFANDLYKVMTNIESGNFAISPFSLSNILAMLLAGAGPGTATDIQKGLRIQDNLTETEVFNGYSQLFKELKNDPNITLEIGNGVFVEKSFDIRDEFLDTLRDKFSAGAESMDFSDGDAVAKRVNDFVKDATRNTIPELISPELVTTDTKALLVNAIYFKGLWKNAFVVNRTNTDAFYTDTENSTKVDYMHQKKKFPYAKLKELNAAAVLLPYKGDRFGLVVVLPNERDGLREVESKLNEFPLHSIPERLKETLLHLSLPKFKLESTVDFVRNKALENVNVLATRMGMSKILSRTVDFSRISPGNNLYLSQVLQKAVFEVSEEGTTASAATAAILVNRVAAIGISFVVNHPFIAFIYDKQTKTILFTLKKTN